MAFSPPFTATMVHMLLAATNRLCVYDSYGRRRYWIAMSELKVEPARGGAVLVTGIPELCITDSTPFTIITLGIEDRLGKMLMTFPAGLTSPTVMAGAVVAWADLTVTIN